MASNQTTLILEDDFRLHPDTNRFVQGLPAQLTYGSVIKLSHARRQKFAAGAVDELYGRRIRTFQIISPHTTGYVIGPEAAARMLATRERFFRPVDIDIKHDWEHGVPVYGVDPALVHEDAGLESTIGEDRAAAKGGSLLYRFVSNTRYQFRFQFDRLRQGMSSKPRNDSAPPDDTE